MSSDPRPIGVFDSGVGGLTVLRALLSTLPDERYIYLGDTARLPYGTKSPATVVRYASRAAALLVDRGVKALVVACNTASAAALPALRSQFAGLPVLGVVEPGADAACKASRSGRIAVIATESTVAGGAYQRAIGQRRADARVTARACQLFVALAEEGWTSGAVASAAAREYLGPLFGDASAAPDTLLLGCTHFPVLAPVLADAAGPDVAIVSSSAPVAHALALELGDRQMRARGTAADCRIQLLATDGVERFARVGATFLGAPISASDVALVDL